MSTEARAAEVTSFSFLSASDITGGREVRGEVGLGLGLGEVRKWPVIHYVRDYKENATMQTDEKKTPGA